jgi:hypothetical protein
VVLSQGHGIGRWCHIGDALAPFVSGTKPARLRFTREGDGDIDFCVLWETLGAR